MAEEQNKEKPKEEQPQEQEKPQEEAKPMEQAPKMVGEAMEAVRQLRSENDRMAENIKQLSELKAFETLGGKSEGKPQEEKPQEESPEDYSEKALQGDIKQEE